MPPPTLRDEVIARRVVARCPNLLVAVVELRERHCWTLTRIAAVLGVGERALLRQVAPLAPDARRCRVLCGHCRWSSIRPMHTARLRPCPRCGSGVRRGRLRGGRPPVAERLGVEATLLVTGYVSPRTWARLRALAGRRSSEIVGVLVERWARGEAIPADWTPSLGGPRSKESREAARESLIGRRFAGLALGVPDVPAAEQQDDEQANAER